MTVSIIIASTGKIVPELIPLIEELIRQTRLHFEINFRIILVTQYNSDVKKELQEGLNENYKHITHINTNRKTGYFGKFNLALEQGQVFNSDIFVFMNDDIVIKSNFLDIIKQVLLDHEILYAPLVYEPDGKIQLSVFRKNYSKFSIFFRYYDEGLYTRVGRFLNILNTNIQNINENRSTVYGCCFIMNWPTITQVVRFDANIFLYYEEIFFPLWLVSLNGNVKS